MSDRKDLTLQQQPQGGSAIDFSRAPQNLPRENEPRRIKACTSGQVLLLSLIGGPWAGCWGIASNYKSYGKHDDKRLWNWAGFGSVVLLGLIAPYIPENIPGIPFVVAYSMALRTAAVQIEQNNRASAVNVIVEKPSTLKLIGVAIGFLLATMVVVFVCVFALYSMQLLPSGFLKAAGK